MLQAGRKMRAIAQVPGQDLLGTMNALIMPRLFSRLDTTAPAGLVPASSALTLFLLANFAFICFRKNGLGTPSEIGNSKHFWMVKRIRFSTFSFCNFITHDSW